MKSLQEAITERVAVAVFAGLVSGFVTLLGDAIFSNRDSVQWALPIAATAIGGLAGLIWGNRSIKGRPAIFITGLLLGCLLGAVSGWCWSWWEFAGDVRQLTAAGIPEDFVTSEKAGLFFGRYQRIALRSTVISGICVGAGAGFLRGASHQFDRNVCVILTAVLMIVLVSIFAARREFSVLSAENIEETQARWDEMKNWDYWKSRHEFRAGTLKD